MKIVFTKKIKCKDALLCADDIKKKIETLTGKFSDGKKSSAHLSIDHTPNGHKIWVFLYDTSGIHESEKKGITVYQDSLNAKKYEGVKITQQKLEKLF